MALLAMRWCGRRCDGSPSAEKAPGLAGGGFGGWLAKGEGADDVVAVHAGDVFEVDGLGAGGFALADVGAVAEALVLGLADHADGAAEALWLPLGQEAEVGDLGRGEQ